MEPKRLRLKSGIYEFEIEGDPEFVAAQAAIWRDWVDSRPSQSPPVVASPPPNITTAIVPPAGGDAQGDDRALLSKIYRHDGRVVALTVTPPAGPTQYSDSMLLLMFGQHVYNGGEPVTGQQLADGMSLSGLRVPRVDRAWGSHLEDYVLAAGEKRGRKYRLNIPGVAKASAMAKELLKQVP